MKHDKIAPDWLKKSGKIRVEQLISKAYSEYPNVSNEKFCPTLADDIMIARNFAIMGVELGYELIVERAEENSEKVEELINRTMEAIKEIEKWAN